MLQLNDRTGSFPFDTGRSLNSNGRNVTVTTLDGRIQKTLPASASQHGNDR